MRGGAMGNMNDRDPNALDPNGLNQANAVLTPETQELMKAMRIEIRSLRTAITDEERLINVNNLEKEKLNNLWVIAKKALEDQKGELMNKEREVYNYLIESHIKTRKINLINNKFSLFKICASSKSCVHIWVCMF